jgi:hypothetical protein
VSRIEEMTMAAWRKLPSEAQEAFGEPQALGPVLAAGLRVMADEVDNGFAAPLPPSIIATLIRERADDLDGAG